MKDLFFICSLIVALVTSNPVPQLVPAQQCSCQQNQYKISSSPITYPSAAGQNSPCTQQRNVQNQTPNRQFNIDGSLNHLLMSKILGNPCLKKILDSSTKLYNLNGHEIQRQPNTGTGPNVINNYFIVPPDFFNLNDTKPVIRSKNVGKRKKASAGKRNRSKVKTIVNGIEDSTISNSLNSVQKINSCTKKEQKRKRSKLKIAKVDDALEESSSKIDSDGKMTKKQKQSSLTKSFPTVVVSDDLAINDYGQNYVDKTTSSLADSNRKKKRKMKKKKPKLTKEETYENFGMVNPIVLDEEKMTPDSINYEEPSKTICEKSQDVGNTSCLKNIESPVDNEELKDFKENSQSPQLLEDTRRARNPKPVKKEQTKNNKLRPDDILKTFYPYMYMGNNWYSNGNFPINYEQFLQPNVVRNSKTSKTRHPNRQTSDSLQKVVEVKVKPKSHKETNTMKPISVETKEKEKNDSTITEIMEKPVEIAQDIPKEIPTNKILKNQKTDDSQIELEPTITKSKLVVTKANLEMPPTVIEDLHEFIMPELGREDIVPSMHSNGITTDYYPVFYDDSPYDYDENYYLKDLEDDRHFYATDRGPAELLNKDRRKYERNDEFKKLNVNMKGRINYRRGFKYQERQETKNENDNDTQRPDTYERIIVKENKPDNFVQNEETRFQTPPLLENPDFRTKQIEKESYNPDLYGYEPIYTDSVENFSDFKTFSDIKPAKFSRLVSYDPDAKKEKVATTNSNPSNDRIETIYAKTRVVKYGITKEEPAEHTSVSIPVLENKNEEKYYNDGHTTFVVAKSLGHIDDFPW